MAAQKVECISKNLLYTYVHKLKYVYILHVLVIRTYIHTVCT